GNTIIYATFNEEMKTSGDGSVLNKDNYRLGGEALPEGVTLAMFGSDGKKVKITFKTEKLKVSESAEGLDLIARVADKAGNSVNAWGEGIDKLTAKIKKEDAPKVTEVSLISADKIEIVIDKKLSRYPANGFIVIKGNGEGKPLGGISYKYEDGKSIITGTLQSDVKPNDPSDVDGYKLEIVEGKIQSDTGMYLTGGVVVERFEDKYAPSFKDIKPVAGSVYGIAIEFDEDIKIDEALAATDLVVTDRKGNKLVPGKDYTVKLADVTVGKDGKVTEVTESGPTAAYLFIEFDADYTVVDGDYKVSTKDDIHYITDANNNIANTFKDKKAKLKD
ncbi:MAG: hypothetical protein GX194_11480, partial [Clostridium sp.]|nr:hypothetical protein [Clostridium sp.]